METDLKSSMGKDAFVKCAEIFLVAKKPLFAKTYYLKFFK